MKVSVIDHTAIINCKHVIIVDVQSALDFALSIAYEYGCHQIVLPKECICEEFFRLSSGVLGEILQKYVTYQIRLAIIGDFSVYTSQPLQDYIRESNRGNHFYFVTSEAEALNKLNNKAIEII